VGVDARVVLVDEPAVGTDESTYIVRKRRRRIKRRNPMTGDDLRVAAEGASKCTITGSEDFPGGQYLPESDVTRGRCRTA
jgi:hypothetical protein